jgi:glycosyltransferase involved in cell wall biosynthesis
MVSECAIVGIRRTPLVASLGITYSEYYAEVPKQLTTVGYGTAMSHKTKSGIEKKRGELAEACAQAAGLAFKPAGSYENPISFHDMPQYYKTVDAVLMTSLMEAAPSPVMEAAAAGRLVIGTPVGHFPLRAYQGAGIIAPIEAEKFKSFTTAMLCYYKENPAAYVDKCHATQDAARQFDWPYMIDEWVELIETAKS